MTDLKPCFYCHSRNVSLDEHVAGFGSSEWAVSCHACGVCGPGSYHEDEAADFWNNRGGVTDGYHTFDELYHHRAVLFSVVVATYREMAWKSKLHHDGTMFDGMFIVGIETPHGQATYHYDIDPYWDMFDCEEVDRAPEWDLHTPDDVLNRIRGLV